MQGIHHQVKGQCHMKGTLDDGVGSAVGQTTHVLPPLNPEIPATRERPSRQFLEIKKWAKYEDTPIQSPVGSPRVFHDPVRFIRLSDIVPHCQHCAEKSTRACVCVCECGGGKSSTCVCDHPACVYIYTCMVDMLGILVAEYAGERYHLQRLTQQSGHRAKLGQILPVTRPRRATPTWSRRHGSTSGSPWPRQSRY